MLICLFYVDDIVPQLEFFLNKQLAVITGISTQMNDGRI